MLAGLALRLFFIAYFPFHSGDAKFYEELARNWLEHGVYGLFVAGRLVPSDMRVPGYPALLAAVYAVFGQSEKAVLVVQAIIDLITCILTALLAARLAPATKRKIVATVALWMAALCPFLANYTATVLTETLATFLTTLALLAFVYIFADPSLEPPLDPRDKEAVFAQAGWWLLGGFLVGVGTLVRPETPLILAAAGIVLSIRWRHTKDWSKLTLAGLSMALGLILPVMPWAIRNARTLGRIEFLAPRYAQTQGDFMPRGFYEWTRTWMVHFGDAYLVPWKLGKAPIAIETLPDSAFDSTAERACVETLLSRYNTNLQMTPLLDGEFARLANERTVRRPLRTYVFIPILRAWFIWFTPRVELLPYSGRLWPPGREFRDNRTDFSVTAGFGLLNFIYAGLAFVGAWRCRRHPALAFLVVFILVRTAFLTQLQTVEPRYAIVCFPAILALGACAWARPDADTSTAV